MKGEMVAMMWKMHCVKLIYSYTTYMEEADKIQSNSNSEKVRKIVAPIWPRSGPLLNSAALLTVTTLRSDPALLLD